MFRDGPKILCLFQKAKFDKFFSSSYWSSERFILKFVLRYVNGGGCFNIFKDTLFNDLSGDR